MTATVFPEKSLSGAASAPPPVKISPLLSAYPRFRMARISRQSRVLSSSAAWMQPLDEVDMHAKIAGPHRKDDCFGDVVADVTHDGNGDVVDIGLSPADVRQAHQLKSKILRVELAQAPVDQAAE
jgi:hypothetical protein